MQIFKNDFFRFFKGGLMEQWTLIEIGMITNRDLALLTANFGWVSLFLIQRTTRHTSKVF